MKQSGIMAQWLILAAISDGKQRRREQKFLEQTIHTKLTYLQGMLKNTHRDGFIITLSRFNHS